MVAVTVRRQGFHGGIRFPMGSPAYSYHFKDKAADFTILNIPFESHAVHPTQIYELLAAAAIMLLAIYLNKKGLKDGIVFMACSLAFTIFRTVNHGLREFNSAQANYLMWQPRLYSIIMVLLSGMLLWIFFFGWNRHKKEGMNVHVLF
jgi:Prolipoprotein diacylglyceryl transferase.